ncbi:MAG TPA: NAD(P)H-hydrate dehydratase, partial [Thermoleophilia bacterium]|nr:NAD(P)H-hydrate dehydratase [Thermoleophilia bacterium]
ALKAEMQEMQATALGPGMGRAEETVALVRELIKEPVPLLIDADGLWALSGELNLLYGRSAPTVLTPHEGELARLLGTSAAEVSARRLAHVREAAARSNAVVLLKGSRSIVAEPGGKAYVIPTGNPGLATPGTGDVLTGVITGQLAKGLPAADAACLGGYLHGLSADIAAEEIGTDGMVAGDLLDTLPLAVEAVRSAGLEEGAGGDTWDEEDESEDVHDH